MRRPPRGGVDRNHSEAEAAILDIASPPSRGRGSKPEQGPRPRGSQHVAPLAGAWIETLQLMWRDWQDRVAPLAGAWIETSYMRQMTIM